MWDPSSSRRGQSPMATTLLSDGATRMSLRNRGEPAGLANADGAERGDGDAPATGLAKLNAILEASRSASRFGRVEYADGGAGENASVHRDVDGVAPGANPYCPERSAIHARGFLVSSCAKKWKSLVGQLAAASHVPTADTDTIAAT